MTAEKNSGYGCGCLVLLGIIGLLGLYSLVNNYLSCACHARSSEATMYVGSMNRAQQAYFLEEGNFTDNIAELGLGISTETNNYTYSSHATPLSAIHYGVSRKSDLKSYVGGVFLGSVEATGELTTFAILCETKSTGTNRPPAPIVQDGMIQCAPETVNLDGEDEQGIFIGEDWTLAYHSANYASVGEYTQALRVTHSITDESIKSKTIQAIAPYLTTSAEYEQGIQVAKTITDYQQKAKALDAIVRRLVATGNHEQAVQITKTIHYYYGSRDKAMAAIESYKNLQ